MKSRTDAMFRSPRKNSGMIRKPGHTCGGVLLITLATLFMAADAPAANGYKVLLKTEESLLIEDYWIDKIDPTVIRLLIHGKNERFARDDIRYITPRSPEDTGVNTVIKRLTFASRTKDAAVEIQPLVDAEPPQNTLGSGETAPTPAAPADPLQKEATELADKLDKAKNAYRETLGNGDLAARQKARSEILTLTESWEKLTERVKDTNKGELPDWWRW